MFYLTFISLFKERSRLCFMRLCFIYAPVFYLTFISLFKEPVFLSLFIADLYALSKGEVAGTKNNESGPVKTSMLWPTPSSDGSQGFHIQTTS